MKQLDSVMRAMSTQELDWAQSDMKGPKPIRFKY